MNKIIIFPTDTVYGIGTSLYNKKGIEKRKSKANGG